MLNVSSHSIHDLFHRALALHQAGQLAQAEALYRQILALDPAFSDAWHLLGVLACQVGQNARAIELIEKAISLSTHPAYYSNLGEALRKAGDLTRAEAMLRRAIAVDSRFVDAYTNLAVILLHQERPGAAVELLQQCVNQGVANAAAWRLLGDAMARDGRMEESLAPYDRALSIEPGLQEARFNRAMALSAMGRPADAAEAFAGVVAAAPDDQQARLMLADAQYGCGRLAEAMVEYRRVIARDPACAEAHAGLANALRAADRLDEAVAGYRRALELRPEHAVTRANLAFAMRDLARLQECAALLRQAVEQKPESAAIHSGLVFTLHLDPSVPPDAIEQEKQRWNQRHAAPLRTEHQPHANPRSPGRPLRIGYLSADFRRHPVGRFMLPLLKHHDRQQVEVFCYSATTSPDGFTEHLQTAADHWRPIVSLSDDAAARAIRADGIDILVDLCNHTIGNRLCVLARRPAPVQITYLAYNAGTGLREIDWRLTDPHIDPPGSEADRAPFEKPLHLARTYWCYPSPELAPAIGRLPAESGGAVTFGSFNYASKVHDRVLELWARVLQEVPHSRLLLHAQAGSRQEHVRQFFSSQGIDPARIELLPRVRENRYFEQYQRVDIALDPFPWAGGTTTCDALFMGVPVITLAGQAGHETLSRGGASLLTNLGLTDWIARSPQEYLDAARRKAADVAALAALRASLRDRMEASVLMDAAAFARDMEAALRHAWINWAA